MNSIIDSKTIHLMAKPVMKVRLQIEEDLGWKVTGLELCARKNFSLWNLR